MGGCPFGAERIRTRGPLFPLPLSVRVLKGGWGPYWMRLGGGWCRRGVPSSVSLRRCQLIMTRRKGGYKPSPWKGEGAPARTLGRMRVRTSGAFPGSPLIRQPAAATFPPVGGRYGNMGTAPQNRRFPSWPPNFSRTTQASTVGTTRGNNHTQAAAPMGEKPVQFPTSRSFSRHAKSTALDLKRGFLGGGRL